MNELQQALDKFVNPSVDSDLEAVFKAAQQYAELLPLLERLVEAREKATQGEWVVYGEPENNLPYGVFADQEADGLKEIAVFAYPPENEEFCLAAANTITEIQKIIGGDDE